MRRLTSAACAVAVLLSAWPAAAVELQPLGVWRHGAFKTSASEITAYDAASKRLFVVNGDSKAIDVLDLSDPNAPRLIQSFSLKDMRGAPNSVAVKDGVVAAALDGAEKTQNGRVVFFGGGDLKVLGSVEVGPIPDMLTFSPDGRFVVVANEGEPNDAVTVDPEGSVAVIDVSAGYDKAAVRLADFRAFDFGPGMKKGRPGATFAQSAEPEYVAIAPDGKTAWVVLQETNALATVDLADARVTAVKGLGFKDYGACPIDASDKDNKVAPKAWPNVKGMYQPDAIAAFSAGGRTWLVSANEGDAQGWKGFNEEKRVAEMKLDETVFPGAERLKGEWALGRLKTTSTMGDADGDGDLDAIYSYGARSITVWSAEGDLVADTCDQVERRLADLLRYDGFNANNDEQGGDSRSDDKGPEPEGVTTGVIGGRTYAFVGLERPGGIMVFDLTDPAKPEYVTYANTRDFKAPPSAPAAGDSGPEGVLFIAAEASPTGEPLLVVANEISGTTRIWRVVP